MPLAPHLRTRDAVVLAAGGSTRLGTPKQLLTRNGEALLARTIRLVRETSPQRLVVVLGARAEQLFPLARDTCVVFNPDWKSGMASSLSLAASALHGRFHPVLVTLTDQPALDAGHLRALLAAYNGEADVVSAYGTAIGAPAVVRAATLERSVGGTGDTGLRQLWRHSTPATVRMDALGYDMDTREDVAESIRLGLLDR